MYLYMIKRLLDCFSIFNRHTHLPVSPSMTDFCIQFIQSYPNYCIYLFEIYIRSKNKYFLIRGTGFILKTLLPKILEDYPDCNICKIYNVTNGELLFSNNKLILDEVHPINLEIYH